MRTDRSNRLFGFVFSVVAAVTFLAVPTASSGEEFADALERVDKALRENPAGVSRFALESCRKRRNFAAQLHTAGFPTRAERGLRFCFETLRVSVTPPPEDEEKGALPSMVQVQAKAAAEVEKALALEPDIANGLSIYANCALCHMPEGWGMKSGSVPQIAGQHRQVVIKQLADIRAGHRDSLLMLPYASVETMGGTQAVADVAGYIDTLEISTATGKGPGKKLDLGKKGYADHCASCHGANGEGNAEAFIPRIQSQHYKYLARQIEWMKTNKRRNSDKQMLAQVEMMGDEEMRAVLDWVSRLEPPEELQAPEGWRNPDFPGWNRQEPRPPGG